MEKKKLRALIWSRGRSNRAILRITIVRWTPEFSCTDKAAISVLVLRPWAVPREARRETTRHGFNIDVKSREWIQLRRRIKLIRRCAFSVNLIVARFRVIYSTAGYPIERANLLRSKRERRNWLTLNGLASDTRDFPDALRAAGKFAGINIPSRLNYSRYDGYICRSRRAAVISVHTIITRSHVFRFVTGNIFG